MQLGCSYFLASNNVGHQNKIAFDWKNKFRSRKAVEFIYKFCSMLPTFIVVQTLIVGIGTWIWASEFEKFIGSLSPLCTEIKLTAIYFASYWQAFLWVTGVNLSRKKFEVCISRNVCFPKQVNQPGRSGWLYFITLQRSTHRVGRCRWRWSW